MFSKTALRSAVRLGRAWKSSNPAVTTTLCVGKRFLASEAGVDVTNVTIPKPLKGANAEFSASPVGEKHDTPVVGGIGVQTRAGEEFTGRGHFRDFDLANGVYIVTGTSFVSGESLSERFLPISMPGAASSGIVISKHCSYRASLCA